MDQTRQAGRLFLIVVILFLTGSFILSIFASNEDILQLYALNALFVSLFCMYVPALSFMKAHPDIDYGRNRITFSQTMLSILLGISAFLLSTGIGGFMSLLAETLGLPEMTAPLPRMQGWRAIASVIVVCVVPAIAEEQLFRGVLLNAWRPFGRRKAILLSSVLFALMHGDPVAIPSVFALAWLLGSLSYSTGSVYPSMTLHMTNNFIALVLNELLLQNSSLADSPAVSTGEALLTCSLYTCIGLLFTIINYRKLVLSIRRSREEQAGERPPEPMQTPPSSDEGNGQKALTLPVVISLVLLLGLVALYFFSMTGKIALQFTGK